MITTATTRVPGILQSLLDLGLERYHQVVNELSLCFIIGQSDSLAQVYDLLAEILGGLNDSG